MRLLEEANEEAEHQKGMVLDPARKQHPHELARLAACMSSAMRSRRANPFSKAKGLITNIIARLEPEAGRDTIKEACCDKQLGETNAKRLEKTTEIETLTSRVYRASVKSENLKAQVST